MPLPVYRFVILGARQLSKPFVLSIVRRAQQKETLTRTVCIALGRFSLGMSNVITKWGDDEARKARRASLSSQNTAKNKATNPIGLPRSRLLLHPNPTNASSHSDGRRAERFPFVQSAFGAFRDAFFVPYSEEKLLSAGAELLVEFLLYFVLALLLYLEIRSAAVASEAKEQHMQQRLDALERKVNEMIHAHHPERAVLLVPPEPQALGRLEGVWRLARRSAEAVRKWRGDGSGKETETET